MPPIRGAVVLCFVSLTTSAGGLSPTPADGRGPFYPDVLPAETDNDLAQVGTRSSPARGDLIELVGRVTDTRGHPMAGVTIELWQADAGGRYMHSADPLPALRDPGFQGFGRGRSDAMGRYRFLTVMPGGYAGRPPHFHVRLLHLGRELLVTQLYLPKGGHEGGMSPEAMDARSAARTIRVERRDRLIPKGRFDFVLGPG